MDRLDDPSRRAFLGIGSPGATNSHRPAECHIASLVVHARPEHQAAIEMAIRILPGAEIHAPQATGKLIVTLETVSTAETMDRIQAIHDLPGIIAVSLIFHQWEPDDGAITPTGSTQG